ncbi:predicted protein [Lichtheimia corymbifera JMRC:FSU:9682]|uniref:Uncharacterized protein n=1 Tax=Lichtheimia corymbifera JMRC:FSU:9682 TaxID=1263082 RepID=A0A068RUI7_9FUNG|nr:predicted protein [Lichtheimia corymbifera JMRC:FSU:9682]
MGASRVFIPGLSTTRSLFTASFGLNMLDDAGSRQQHGDTVLFEGRTLLRITTSIKKAFPRLYHWHVKDVIVLPIQMHPLTTVAVCGSTAQVVPKSTDEGLIWVTVKFGVLAPCFLRGGASRQYWYLGILWHCVFSLSLLFLAAGILADQCTLIKRFK